MAVLLYGVALAGFFMMMACRYDCPSLPPSWQSSIGSPTPSQDYPLAIRNDYIQ